MIEDQIAKIHDLVRETFPEAVSVEIFVNSEGIDAKPKFATNLNSYSMKNISGGWARKANEVTQR